jgi:hypothetical protein
MCQCLDAHRKWPVVKQGAAFLPAWSRCVHQSAGSVRSGWNVIWCHCSDKLVCVCGAVRWRPAAVGGPAGRPQGDGRDPKRGPGGRLAVLVPPHSEEAARGRARRVMREDCPAYLGNPSARSCDKVASESVSMKASDSEVVEWGYNDGNLVDNETVEQRMLGSCRCCLLPLQKVCTHFWAGNTLAGV